MKPILFNTDMVRAILDGRKTVTRRVVKPQPFAVEQQENTPVWCGHFVSESGKVLVDKPPYRPGDILYVRETWTTLVGSYIYKANQKPGMKNPGKWRPSIHMPREAVRIFLLVTDVRVEWLWDITEESAQSEGLYLGWKATETSSMAMTAKQAFMWVWNSTIKPADRAIYGWEANPWVWVIEFERCEKPKEVSP